MKRVAVVALVLGCVSSLRCASAQFDLEESHSQASLRGVDSVGAGVAWASGTGGTVLRTEDGGFLWQTCAMPKGAEKLDFRGAQGFDAKTAVVMSSGPGKLSKIYRTTDGCATWTLVFEDPDATGFFDAIRKVTDHQMYVLGDPVAGRFAIFYSPDQGATWFATDDPGREAGKEVGAFAASNSSLAAVGGQIVFGVGASRSEPPKVYRSQPDCQAGAAPGASCGLKWVATTVPMAGGSTSAGVFSVDLRAKASGDGKLSMRVVAVGGDYTKPAGADGTASWSADGGEHWTAAESKPSGYRSAVEYSRETGTWMAVGPGGTDMSKDDGITWTPVAGDTATGWNALSLPFVVGEKGKIGKLRAGVLK